jgi:hypothetical protein
MTTDREAAETAALVILARENIPGDVQELLVYGDPERGIRPGALRRALLAADAPAEGTRAAVIEEVVKAIRDACEPILTDRNAYVLTGPAGIVMAAVAAVRALASQPPRQDGERVERLREALEKITHEHLQFQGYFEDSDHEAQAKARAALDADRRAREGGT